MLATPLRPFLKEQIIPRPQESMGIFGRITESNARPEVKKTNQNKKTRTKIFNELAIFS